MNAASRRSMTSTASCSRWRTRCSTPRSTRNRLRKPSVRRWTSSWRTSCTLRRRGGPARPPRLQRPRVAPSRPCRLARAGRGAKGGCRGWQDHIGRPGRVSRQYRGRQTYVLCGPEILFHVRSKRRKEKLSHLDHCVGVGGVAGVRRRCRSLRCEAAQYLDPAELNIISSLARRSASGPARRITEDAPRRRRFSVGTGLTTCDVAKAAMDMNRDALRTDRPHGLSLPRGRLCQTSPARAGKPAAPHCRSRYIYFKLWRPTYRQFVLPRFPFAICCARRNMRLSCGPCPIPCS